MSKQDRIAARTDLERKYQFGKQFAEIMGVATDARDAAYAVDDELHGANGLVERHSSLRRDLTEFEAEVGDTYATSDDYDDLKSQVSNLSVKAGAIEGSVSQINQKLADELNAIKKYFSFTINGLEIGASYTDPTTGAEMKSPYHVVIDNDEISIMVGDNPVQRFDAEGNALIPTLKVEESANLVGLQVSRTPTHLNFAYIGGANNG